jgi:hypothetical protein
LIVDTGNMAALAFVVATIFAWMAVVYTDDG